MWFQPISRHQNHDEKDVSLCDDQYDDDEDAHSSSSSSSSSVTTMGGDTTTDRSVDLLLGFSQQQQQSSSRTTTNRFLFCGEQHSKKENSPQHQQSKNNAEQQQEQQDHGRVVVVSCDHHTSNDDNQNSSNAADEKRRMGRNADHDDDHKNNKDSSSTICSDNKDHPVTEKEVPSAGNVLADPARQDLIYDMSQLSQIPRALSDNNKKLTVPEDDRQRVSCHAAQSVLIKSNYYFIRMQSKSEFGMHVRRLSSNNGDVVVSDLRKNSQAEQCGVKVGDVLYRAPGNCHCQADWDRFVLQQQQQQQQDNVISLQRYSVQDIANLSKSMVRPAIFIVKRSQGGNGVGNATAIATTTTATATATTRKDTHVFRPQQQQQQHQVKQSWHCSLAKKDIQKILSLVDGNKDLGLLTVPCCRACCQQGPSPSTMNHGGIQRHHFLCPKHQDFPHSGAREKLIILLAGALYDCEACIYELEHGRKHSSAKHNDKCSKASVQVKNNASTTTTEKKNPRGKKNSLDQDRTSLPTRKKQKVMNHNGKQVNDGKKLVAKRTIHQTKEKETKTQQPKRNLVGTAGKGATTTTTSRRESTLGKTKKVLLSKSTETNPTRQELDVSSAPHSYAKQTTSKSGRKKQTLANDRDIGKENNQEGTTKDNRMKRSQQPIVSCHTQPQDSSSYPHQNEKLVNVMHVTPVPNEPSNPVNIEKSVEAIDALPIILTDDATVPKWVPCPNPWGDRRYQDGDFVLYSPLDYLTAFEMYGENPNRFTMFPFKGDQYKMTHIPPTEKCLDLVQLNRDRLGLKSWGFRYCYHDFGGACLVTDIEPMSPADSGTILGTENEETRLYPNDMIICVNNKKVGGMTELELGVELDLAGPELVLAVSRFRTSTINVASTCSNTHVSTSAETPSLHWKEIGMEKDVSYSSNSGQRFESCEDTPPEEYGEESSHPTSKKIMISNHFADNDRKSNNKSEAENLDTNTYNNERFMLNLVEKDNKIEDTNTYNNDGCASNLVENDNSIEGTKACNKDGCMPNTVENDNKLEDTKTCNKDGCMPNAVETSFNLDASEQSNSVDDVTLTGLLQKLDFKEMPESIRPIASSRNRSGYKGVEKRTSKGHRGSDKYYAYFTSKQGRIIYGPFNAAIHAAKMYAWAFFVQNGKSAYQEALLADEKKEEDNVEGHNNTVEHMIQSLDIKNIPSFIEPIKSCSQSGYKGVWLQNKRYHAQFYYDNSSFRLGSYFSKVDAAKMYAWAYYIVHGQESLENAQRQGLEIELQSKASNKCFGKPVVNNNGKERKDEALSKPTGIYACNEEETQEKSCINDTDVECRGSSTKAIGNQVHDQRMKNKTNASDKATKRPRSPFHSICIESSMQNKSEDTPSSTKDNKDSCTDETDTEWESDSNPWLGCVCGETHEKPVPVFWVQCDSCDAWYNCSSSCVGFTEDEANHMKDWICPDCLLTGGENGIHNYHTNKDEQNSVQSTFGNKNQNCESAVLPIGSIVDVEDRTWVGSNKPGGVAKIVNVHMDEDHCITYDVKYVLENRTERNIESEYISLNRGMMDTFASPSCTIRKTRVSPGSAKSRGAPPK